MGEVGGLKKENERLVKENFFFNDKIHEAEARFEKMEEENREL